MKLGSDFFLQFFLLLATYLIMKEIHISFRKQKKKIHIMFLDHLGTWGIILVIFMLLFLSSIQFPHLHASSGFPTNPTLGVVIGLYWFHTHWISYLTSIWIFDSSQISNDTSYGIYKCSCENKWMNNWI